METNRIVFLDYVRVLACFMVIMVHSCEFFFIDGSEIGIRTADDGFWVSLVDSAFRCSVPLFVMTSSYLLLPLQRSTGAFFRRRFVRVVVPFAVWSVLYATLPVLWGDMQPADVGPALLRLLTNFNDASGHLWFIYMLLGLYLFMPVLSPWLEKAGKRELQGFLVLWFLSTFWHYAHRFVPSLYGECYWNEFHTLWYFSGFIGYLVLAHYVRRYIDWPLRKALTVGGLCFAAGYAFTAVVFYERTFTADTLQSLELSWRFNSFNVVLATFGVFVMCKSLFRNRRPGYGLVNRLSGLSYGIYLMHIFILGFSYRLVEGLFSTPVTIAVVGCSTFVACCLLSALLSRLPGSRYLLG